MAQLAVETKQLNFHLEQVQDFTPTPMTVSTETWYTGYHPYTLTPVFSAKRPNEKQEQRMFFFWYLPEEKHRIIGKLQSMHRPDLIKKLYPGDGFTRKTTEQAPRKRSDKENKTRHNRRR
jgi:radical SAM superfamily enzyme YgiQ (UPF0313 family)